MYCDITRNVIYANQSCPDDCPLVEWDIIKNNVKNMFEVFSCIDE